MHPAVDLERLAEFSDGTDEGLRTLVGIFLEDVGQMIGELRAAVTGGDAAEIRLLAHRTGGSSSACGAAGLSERLAELEEAARTGRLDGRHGMMAAIDTELDRVTLFLKAYLTSLGKTE
jgi:HPt (histidine-containing phosphotransfer) domain-containing protein